MASFVRKAMVYLGLADDEYDEYDTYDETGHEPARGSARPQPAREREREREREPEPAGSIRTLRRADTQVVVEDVAPPAEAPAPPASSRPPAVVRQINQGPPQTAKVHVVAPLQFSDAQEIGDRLKISQPVIVNLQNGDRELSRRMIDFCSGATYALGGSMDKVADQVFLLTPSNVEVSAEEKRRLQERGLYRA